MENLETGMTWMVIVHGYSGRITSHRFYTEKAALAAAEFLKMFDHISLRVIQD